MAINYNITVTGDCQNTGTGGAALFNFTSGVPPYTIDWLTPDLGVDVTNTTSFLKTGLSADTFIVLVNDSTLPVNNINYINIPISSGTCVSVSAVINSNCAGNTGSITATSVSNIGDTTYSLYSGGTLLQTITNGSGSVSFYNLNPGQYYVNVLDSGGCTAQTESIIVNQSDLFDFGLYVVDNPNCDGPQGKIFVTGLTGTPPYTYIWSNAEITPAITGLTSGSYSVTITDANGCQVTKTGVVNTVSPIGLSSFTYNNPSCFSSDGEITFNISGGTGPYYYLGSNGVSQISYSKTVTFTGLPATLFTLTVTDAALCSFTTSYQLLTPNSFTVVGFDTKNSSCGDKGSITVSVLGGSPPYTYTLIDPSGNTQNFSTNSTTYEFQNLAGGTYSVAISDSSTCTYIQEVTIITETLFTVSATTTGTTCGLDNGVVILSKTLGGTAPYDYVLSNGLFYNDWPLDSAEIDGLPAGEYTYEIIDSTGCSEVGSFTISSSPIVDFSLYKPNCEAQSPGRLHAFINSGTPPFTLTWSNNVNGQTGLDVTGLTAGTYSLTVIDSLGCSQTQTVEINCATPFVSYQIANICSGTFVQTQNTLRTLQNMLYDGYLSVTEGETNCVLNSAVFSSVVEISGVTYSLPFYTATTITDIPSDLAWQYAIENLLNTIPGISQYKIISNGSIIQIYTDCAGGNIYADETLSINLGISYDVSCELLTSPTPTPTNTPTLADSPTPTPTLTVTPTVTPTLTVTPTSTISTGLTCSASVVPPITINGIDITESSVGSVSRYGFEFTSCGTVTTPVDSLFLGATGSFEYTMNFSQPVNNVIIFITATGQFSNENFIFTTDTGTGIPTITSTENCYTTIVGNEIISGLGAPAEGGGGKFTITNDVPFTTLVITGDGGDFGSLLSICANSII